MKPTSILSDEEIALIKGVVSNPKTVEALKKVLLSSLYDNGTLQKDAPAEPLKNWALGAFFTEGADRIDDAQLGRSVRASAMGIQMVESGFKKLITIGTDPVKKEGEEEVNQAR